MADILTWPICTLRPQMIAPNPVPFTRSGGASIGGIEPAIRTDIGWWEITYQSVVLQNKYREQWQTWHAIRQYLSGRSGLIAVPVRQGMTGAYPPGAGSAERRRVRTTHSDGTPFSDGSLYVQAGVSIISVGATPIGATTIKLKPITPGASLSGVMFSYQHAMYETGPVIDIDASGNWLVPISPSVRQAIPAGADLEFDMPTCLCRLKDDRGMDVDQNAIQKNSLPSVVFVEATNYWNALALGLV